jgi:hypothetical protein
MLIDFPYRNHIRRAVEQDDPVLGECMDGASEDLRDAEAAEVRRMIELSGMIGLECRLIEDA